MFLSYRPTGRNVSQITLGTDGRPPHIRNTLPCRIMGIIGYYIGESMSKSLAVLIGLAGPLVVWALVFAIERSRVFDQTSVLRVLSAWRLLSWLAAILFLIASCLTSPPTSTACSRYFWSILCFSLGLFLPQQWLKRQGRPREMVDASKSFSS